MSEKEELPLLERLGLCAWTRIRKRGSFSDVCWYSQQLQTQRLSLFGLWSPPHDHLHWSSCMTESAPCMSVLLLDLRSLILAGRCKGLSTSSPLSTSQEVMDACDRLPWDEWVLPTDLLNTNLGEIKSAFEVMYDGFVQISIVSTVPKPSFISFTVQLQWVLSTPTTQLLLHFTMLWDFCQRFTQRPWAIYILKDGAWVLRTRFTSDTAIILL